ncbi:hypothetical protein BSNK01_11790 [Bacillaceae bacterium]
MAKNMEWLQEMSRKALDNLTQTVGRANAAPSSMDMNVSGSNQSVMPQSTHFSTPLAERLFRGLVQYRRENPVRIPFAPGTPTFAKQRYEQDFREDQRRFNINAAANLSQLFGYGIQPKMSGEALFRQVEGQPTLAAREFDWNRMVDEAQLIGFYNGEPTFERERWQSEFDWGRAIDEARLTGYYNGTPTFDRERWETELDLGLGSGGSGSTVTERRNNATAELHDAMMDLIRQTDDNGGRLIGMPQAIEILFSPKMRSQIIRDGIDVEPIIDSIVYDYTGMTKEEYFKKYPDHPAKKLIDKYLKEVNKELEKQKEETADWTNWGLQLQGATRSNFLASRKGGDLSGLTAEAGISDSRRGYNNLWKLRQARQVPQRFRQFVTLLDRAVEEAGVPPSWKPYLAELFGRESSWNPRAKNPSSSAYGYAQFIASTRKAYEKKYPQYNYNNPLHQLVLGIHYVKDRYNHPINALRHWDAKKWY